MRGGDEGAFGTIFRTYYADLVGLATAVLRERPAAEDVVQDVLLELWRRRANIVLETSLRAYLFRAARNRALNHIRNQRVAGRIEPGIPGPRSAPGADHEVMQKEMAQALEAAVAALPDRCREVFELSRVHGLKYAEIAGVLDISIKTVEAQMGKAIRTIRQRLAPWLPEGGGL